MHRNDASSSPATPLTFFFHYSSRLLRMVSAIECSSTTDSLFVFNLFFRTYLLPSLAVQICDHSRCFASAIIDPVKQEKMNIRLAGTPHQLQWHVFVIHDDAAKDGRLNVLTSHSACWTLPKDSLIGTNKVLLLRRHQIAIGLTSVTGEKRHHFHVSISK